MAVALAVIFLFGLAVGSFLNVLIIRSGRAESLGGRSRCDSCKTSLSVRELIPVVSYLLQSGRCRRCGATLSIQYPLVELGTALGFAFAWWQWGSPQFPPAPDVLLTFGAIALGIAAAIFIVARDLTDQTIPDGPTVLLFLLGVGASIARALPAEGWVTLAYDWGGAIFVAGCLAALWLVSGGRWIGLGDAKLIFAGALAIGFPESIVALLFAFWLGGLAGALLLISRSHTLRSRIAFGPFILAASALSHFFARDFLILSGLMGLVPRS